MRRSTGVLHALAAAAALVSIAACGTPADESRAATAVGSDGSVGDVEVRSMLLVTTGEGEPARLLGTLVSGTAEKVVVVVEDDDDRVELTVPADGELPLDTKEAVLRTSDDPAGARTVLSLSIAGTGTDIEMPLVDGTLDQYEQYVPDAA